MLHHHILRSFVDRGFPPTPDELARLLATSRADVDAQLDALAAAHGCVLHPGTHDVWIAHPFTSSPTGTWVESGDLGWWASCMWCAAGIVALAAPTATIHTRLGAERHPLTIEVRGGEPQRDLMVHFPTPLRDAWNNVVHTCASIQPFSLATDVDDWCTRHGMRRGAIVPLRQVFELGRAWYGGHLAKDWHKWTLAETREIFTRVGLTGDHWAHPGSDGTF